MSNPTTKSMIQQFHAAYAGSGISARDIELVYNGWLKCHQNRMSIFPADLRASALGELVRQRCQEIYSESNTNQIHELTADRIWAELWPISDRALNWARRVKVGGRLITEDCSQLEIDRQQADRISTAIEALPDHHKQSISEVLSEAHLDQQYVLENGNAPKSLRLGR